MLRIVYRFLQLSFLDLNTWHGTGEEGEAQTLSVSHKPTLDWAPQTFFQRPKPASWHPWTHTGFLFFKVLVHLTLTKAVGYTQEETILSIWKMWKLSLREVQWLVQDHSLCAELALGSRAPDISPLFLPFLQHDLNKRKLHRGLEEAKPSSCDTGECKHVDFEW